MSEALGKEYSPKEIAVFEGLFQLAASGKSFSGIKVQDIATAAGIGKGTVYEYFASKEEILSSAILFALDQLLTWIEDVLSKQLPLRQTLEQFSDKLELDQRDMVRSLVMLVASMSQEQRIEVRTWSEAKIFSFFPRLKQATEQLFRAGRRNGEIDPRLDDRFCEYVVLSALVGHTAGRIPVQEEGHCLCDKSVMVDMICRALRP